MKVPINSKLFDQIICRLEEEEQEAATIKYLYVIKNVYQTKGRLWGKMYKDFQGIAKRILGWQIYMPTRKELKESQVMTKKRLVREKDKWYLKYLEAKKNNNEDEANRCLKEHEKAMKILIEFLQEI